MPESEPYPHKIYNISLFGETLTFFTLSLRHYEAILGNDLHRVQNDANLRLFLNDQQIGSLRVGYEVERVKEAASRFQAMIEADPAPFATHHLSLTYEYLKLMKSAAELYLGYLQRIRDEIANDPTLSRLALQAVDQQLVAMKGKAEVGIFYEIKPQSLMVQDQSSSLTLSHSPVEMPILASTPSSDQRPVIIEGIEFLDQQLRDRCMDLFNDFRKNNETHRLDTVLNEATRILEDRIRTASRAPDTVKDLASYAFADKIKTLVVGKDGGEQDAVFHLFRGFLGVFRNPVHHHLVPNLLPERVLELVGMTDYLLSMVDGAQFIGSMPAESIQQVTPSPAPSQPQN